MNPDKIFKRTKYSEAQNYLNVLEIRLLKEKKLFRLQEAVAIVWTMINGKRTLANIYSSLSHVISIEVVDKSILELKRLKLIK